jgi:hypothetical protein
MNADRPQANRSWHRYHVYPTLIRPSMSDNDHRIKRRISLVSHTMRPEAVRRARVVQIAPANVHLREQIRDLARIKLVVVIAERRLHQTVRYFCLLMMRKKKKNPGLTHELSLRSGHSPCKTKSLMLYGTWHVGGAPEAEQAEPDQLTVKERRKKKGQHGDLGYRPHQVTTYSTTRSM